MAEETHVHFPSPPPTLEYLVQRRHPRAPCIEYADICGSCRYSTNTPDSDHDLLRVNFDITLPRVSCQYASIDLDDVMGRRRDNVTQNVMKWTIDGKTGDFKSYADSVPAPPAFRHSTWRVLSTRAVLDCLGVPSTVTATAAPHVPFRNLKPMQLCALCVPAS